MYKFVRRAFFFSIGLLLTKPYGRRALFEVAKSSFLAKVTSWIPLLQPDKTKIAVRRHMLYCMQNAPVGSAIFHSMFSASKIEQEILVSEGITSN